MMSTTAHRRKVTASMAMTSAVPSFSANDAKRARLRERSEGSAMIATASAGEMIPANDHVVCIIPLARLVPAWHRRRRTQQSEKCCRQRDDTDANQHPNLKVACQH